MLLTTRDAQREKRNSLYLASAALADRISNNGFDNLSFRADSVSDLRTPVDGSSQLQHQPRSILQELQIERIADHTTNENQGQTKKKWKYKWKMTHFFYIHITLFFINSLIGGLIIYLIENYSSSRNREMEVAYIDAWFVCATCVFSCGLTTLDFAKLSLASQLILMFLTFISGITISTLPALAIKAYTHKHVRGLRVDDDHGKAEDNEEEIEDDELPTFNVRRQRNLPQHVRDQLASLPKPTQLRYRAYVVCIVMILGTCGFIYFVGFITIGAWLDAQYTPEQLMQGNQTVSPWYISFVVVLTGFNQNGLTPFSTGFSRFVYDVYLNIFVMLVVMFGTSLFPFLLRNVVIITRQVVPWRHKIIFDYILTNNHRLSTLLFPAVQTRIYLLITICLYGLSIIVSLSLDLHSAALSAYPAGTRVLIFFFHTINSRFAGFQTIDISAFAMATLLVYLLLMATKPQMLCAIDESPLEMNWLALQAKEEVAARTSLVKDPRRTSNASMRSRTGSITSTSTGVALPMKQMERFLRRQSFVTKDLARKEFANLTPIDGNSSKPKNLRILRTRLFLVYFARALIKHTASFVILTRTWLFFFIFLICAIEYRRMAPVDSEITVFKIVFEIISAFGTVGLSLGYPNVSSSFSTVLSPASKVIVLLTMFMGRHRGLLASMKDQEVIEFSAAELLKRQREQLIEEYERETVIDYPIHRF